MDQNESARLGGKSHKKKPRYFEWLRSRQNHRLSYEQWLKKNPKDRKPKAQK
jgi:hypothetical protein